MTASDSALVRELVLCTVNNGELYRQNVTPTIAALRKKAARGVYDATRAVKAWEYVALAGIRAYRAEHGLGPVARCDREAIARELAAYYAEEVES